MQAFWLVLTYDLLEDRCIDDVIIKTFFNSLLYKTNRFHITMWLLSNQSQMMSELWWEWKKAHKMQPSVTLMFIQHFDIICDVILYRSTATCNLFVLYD